MTGEAVAHPRAPETAWSSRWTLPSGRQAAPNPPRPTPRSPAAAGHAGTGCCSPSPFLWCIAAIGPVNEVPYVFGRVPFLLVWMVLGVLVGTAAIAAVYAIDRRRGDLDRL
ncbi:MAG: DUF3311 domain-containing protein [Streptosporangiales bacterium]|nr:DUF3311 domain-containing protein [Streptosporangiales bacterium]